MLGFKYIKSQPTMYLMQVNDGKIKRAGAGQSFFYYAPYSTLIAIPIGSRDNGFILEMTTVDYQNVTVQGEITYRIADPQKISQMFDFSLAANGHDYSSDDPALLGNRLITQVEMIINQTLQKSTLKEALCLTAELAEILHNQLQDRCNIQSLGIEILNVTIIAIKPTPAIANALEAKAREEHLKSADDAIYSRRMSAVENERAIRQNELDTEIAIEEKKSEIQEAQMKTIAIRMRKDNELRDEQLQADIALEEKRTTHVVSQAENSRILAQAEAYKVAVLMEALEKTDPRTIQALAAIGMKPEQLIAQAFGGIAENAEKIGQLNMSPELLNALMKNAE